MLEDVGSEKGANLGTAPNEVKIVQGQCQQFHGLVGIRHSGNGAQLKRLGVHGVLFRNVLV